MGVGVVDGWRCGFRDQLSCFPACFGGVGMVASLLWVGLPCLSLLVALGSVVDEWSCSLRVCLR